MKRKANDNKNKDHKKKLTEKKSSINNITKILSLLGIDEDKTKTDKENLKKLENNNIQEKKKNNIEIFDDQNEPKTNKNKDAGQFIKTESNNKKGFVNKEYIIKKIKEKNIFDKNEFYLQNVTGDGNCGYRCISLQLYGTENLNDNIRQEVFNYLDKNRTTYKEYNFEYNNKILNSNDYIDIIKNNGEWMGELEIIAITIIYNVNILLFQINENEEIEFVNKYGNIDNNTKMLLTLCFINHNHFNVLYEKQPENRKNNDNFENYFLDKKSHKPNNNIKLEINMLDFKYANDNNKITIIYVYKS